ncbi:hypothetical protein K7432_007251 [Basidiobolus ranarum]|uniref:Uncharacterized protein n=1 Tax=Basidiobolus ranarum TaxID=34480 RepID=A0ABR2WTL2_9FUNG
MRLNYLVQPSTSKHGMYDHDTKYIAKNLREKFGNDTILMLGNWSAGNVKYHEPNRGVGMRKMLAKEGFQLYLLDQFITSSLCPTFQNGELEKPQKVQNPIPYKREKYPIVYRHGLLRCKNQQCLKAVTDTTFNLHSNGERPGRFCRLKEPLSIGYKRKGISSDSSSRPMKKANNPVWLSQR